MFWEGQVVRCTSYFKRYSGSTTQKDQDECGWMISNNGHNWILMNTLKDMLKIDVSGELVLRQVNLLIQKTTADDVEF